MIRQCIVLHICIFAVIESLNSKDRTEYFLDKPDATPTLSWIVKFNGSTNHEDAREKLTSRIEGLISHGEIVNGHHLFAYKLSSNKTAKKLTREHLGFLSFTNYPANEEQTYSDVRNFVTAALEMSPEVEWFSQQVLRYRHKRQHFNDPFYRMQWHLKNRQHKGMDINVTGVWKNGFHGSGITTCVLDDGLEWRNKDIEPNYVADGSYDLDDHDSDPSPSARNSDNHHGTRCAGEIAAVGNNHFCGVGIAPEGGVSAIRILDGRITDHMEAFSLGFKPQINDIYSCSWGPADDGKAIDGPHHVTKAAILNGVRLGRHRYGSLFVVASGNGGLFHDDCNFDGYANSPFTLTVGAINEEGRVPNYAEPCAPLLCVAFGSGTEAMSIVTTDWFRFGARGCTDRFAGTSAAAPMAAGVMALMLNARSCLTWRDVQYVLAMTAAAFNGTRRFRRDEKADNYVENGAGMRHNVFHGFGLMDAWRAVQVARVWPLIPPLKSLALPTKRLWTDIDKWPKIMTSSVTVEESKDGLSIVEYALVTVSYQHPRRGALEFRLISPAGTTSILASRRPFDWSSGKVDWTFTSLQFFGESPVGSWRLEIVDRGVSGPGFLHEWQLQFTGTTMTRKEFENRKRLAIDICEGRLHINKSLKCPAIEKPATKKLTVTLSFAISAAFVMLFVMLMGIGVKKFRFVFNVNAENNDEMVELQHPLLQGTQESSYERQVVH